MDYLKNRLVGTEGKWIDELPGVLWAYRTAKGDQLTKPHFPKEIIPPHIIVPSISIEVGNIYQTSEHMRTNFDMLKEE